MLGLLRNRDFALFWGGTSVSLLGDGVYLVAIAWLVYGLENSPASFALVGVAWTVPQLLFLIVGGAASDRFDRRRVMVASNLVSGFSIGLLALLALTDSLAFWHIFALVALYGTSVAFFIPASKAVIPDLVDPELLVQANALRQFVRPLTLRLLGPALGGVLVAGIGAGGALLVDGLTFLVAAAALVVVRTRPRELTQARTAFLHEVAEGVRFVSRTPWLWISLLAASVWLLLYVGPMEVLIPFIVKNELDGGATGLGLVFAAGGLGAMVGSALVGRHGAPHNPLALTYIAWALSTFALATIALAGSLWLAAAAAFTTFGLVCIGDVLWASELQRRVPGDLLGRVASLDWLVSIALVPVSFSATGPVAASVGATTTLFAAGAAGGVLLLVVLAAFRPLRQPSLVAAKPALGG
jgi:MFS family permease